MARRARDSAAPLRRISEGWMGARTGRLSAGVGHRHRVTIRIASLMVGSMRRVWPLRQQTGAQYPADECTTARAADSQRCSSSTQAGASEPPLDRDAWCQLFAKCIKLSAIREQPIKRYSEVFGLEAEWQCFTAVVDF